jgi:hypothetical protein
MVLYCTGYTVLITVRFRSNNANASVHPVQPTMNPRLESLRVRAAESAQKPAVLLPAVLLLLLCGGRGALAFATHEHVLIGNGVLLPSGAAGGASFFHLENGNSHLSYGMVVALGGDHYGIPSAPISDASDPVVAFNNSFRTLASAPDRLGKPDPGFAPSTAYKYMARALITGPEETIVEVLATVKSEGKQPSAAYKSTGSSLDERWNVISGGGSALTDWYPFGRYVKLAVTNWDHFIFDGRAWTAYSAGHRLALQAAERAFQGNRSDSDLAPFVYEAFAQHFLTDMFSSGHMRTPRKIFHTNCTPSKVGDYLARYMHDEDCLFGLNVTNKNGDRWTAYGDKRYMDDVNRDSRVVTAACVQAAVNEVAEVMRTGRLASGASVSELASDDFAAAACVPIVDEINSFVPMFKWDGTQLLRRDDLNNLGDDTFKEHGGIHGWWSATTLTELEVLYGPPADLPPFPNNTLAQAIAMQQRWRLQGLNEVGQPEL